MAGNFWADGDKKENAETVILEEGDVVSIKPGIFHSFLAEKETLAIEVSPQNHKKSDTKYYN